MKVGTDVSLRINCNNFGDPFVQLTELPLSTIEVHGANRQAQQILMNSCELRVRRREGGRPSWVKFVGKHPHHQFPSRQLGQPSANLPISLSQVTAGRGCTYTH